MLFVSCGLQFYPCIFWNFFFAINDCTCNLGLATLNCEKSAIEQGKPYRSGFHYKKENKIKKVRHRSGNYNANTLVDTCLEHLSKTETKNKLGAAIESNHMIIPNRTETGHNEELQNELQKVVTREQAILIRRHGEIVPTI